MKMNDDLDVVVTQQLNLNGTDDGLELWEDDFMVSAHDLSLNESSSSSNSNHNCSNLIKKCFEFIREHARDADPELILSLLNSERDNPTGLESIMCDMFNIPNALEIIQEFKKSPLRAGDKRGMAGTSSEQTSAKKKKKDTSLYLKQLKDMFPDADGLFLITECQQLESWEDFSRFVDTVMLSGVYPKRGGVEFAANAGSSVEVLTIEDPPVVAGTPGEESSKQKKEEKEDKKEMIDLTDQSSNDTVIYDPSPLPKFQESLNDLKKSEVRSNDKQPAVDSAIPGPSGEGARRRRQWMSFAAGDATEKSLAEILEEKKSRRKSLNSRTTKGVVHPVIVVSDAEGVSKEGDGAAAQLERSETDGGSEEGEAREEWLTEQTLNLIRIFPNTDPSYLREQLLKMNGSGEAVNEFVAAKLERNDMPPKADYEKRLEMEELQNRYTKNFSIEEFLKAVPDPWAYFEQKNRNCAKYKSHSLSYLKSAFRKHFVRDIIDTFNKNDSNLYLTCRDLRAGKLKMRTSQRSILECNHKRPTTIDIQFLQEVAFIENEDKIKQFLVAEKRERQLKFEEAKRTGSLLECQCCFDAEVMVEDMFYCPRDHAFCRTCITRSVEVELGYGRHKFVCLSNCEEKFTVPCLQNVLSPELFSKVIKAIQMEEIRAAEIEDLVQCPFCNYATIMPPEVKVLACLNPECLKESCRLCKELNHIPLRCDEVEKSEEVKMRTYIENKMTEALVRTCYSCGKKFVKEDGCNKMTCTCGAKMCYICRKPVTDYSHFNGQGGTEYHKCPLYTNNDELHVDLVKRIGEEAKLKILQENPNTKLIHDPTAVAPRRTNQRSLPGVNNGAALVVAMRAVMGTLEPEDENDRRKIRREANPHHHRHHHGHRHHHRHHHRRGHDETDSEEDSDEQDSEDEEDEPRHRRQQRCRHPSCSCR